MRKRRNELNQLSKYDVEKVYATMAENPNSNSFFPLTTEAAKSRKIVRARRPNSNANRDSASRYNTRSSTRYDAATTELKQPLRAQQFQNSSEQSSTKDNMRKNNVAEENSNYNCSASTSEENKIEENSLSENIPQLLMQIILARDEDVCQVHQLLKQLGCVCQPPTSASNPDHASWLRKSAEILNNGGHLIILGAMQKHSKNIEVQCFGCMALTHACFDNTEFSRAVVKMGAFPSMLSAIKSSDHPLLKLFAGKCLIILCRHAGLPNQSHGTTSEVINTIITFLFKTQKDTEIAQHACLALQKLCQEADLRKVVFDAGGIAALSTTLQCHPDDNLIQSTARSTIKILL